MPSRKIYFLYLLIFLGMMSAFGPFVTDMYLPTLPSMAEEFMVSVSDVQMGITMSLLGLAFGQIFFGPLSDRYGRKPIMFWSLILFVVATAADIYSTDIFYFNLFRFIQGMGGAGGIVLSRSVVTDCYSGRELAKTMAIIGAINGIAPIAAPVAGGLVAASYGWRGVFTVLLGLGAILIVLSVPFVESLSRPDRIRGGFKKLYGNFFLLIKEKSFLYPVIFFSFANGVLFSYISSAPFITETVFGYSDKFFSLIFAVNALSIVIGSAVSLRFKNLKAAVSAGALITFILSLGLIINSLVIRDFLIYEVCTWLLLFGLGIIFPSITTIAMNNGRLAVGAASAIVGASGFLIGGIVSPLGGLGDILITSAILMTSSSIFMIFFLKKIV